MNIKSIKSYISNSPAIKSAVHTFLATFVFVLVEQIHNIPIDAILSPMTWTVAAVSGILMAALRAAIKSIFPFK